MQRIFLFTGALFAFIGIAAGAFGAHILKHQLSTEMLSVFETAVRYQMYHALGLILLASIPGSLLGKWKSFTGWFFMTGTLLFSGSLYVLSLTGIRWVGAVTPIGGTIFLLGWLGLALGSLRKSPN